MSWSSEGVYKAVQALLSTHRGELHMEMMRIIEELQPGEKLYLDLVENLPEGLKLSSDDVRDVLRVVVSTAFGMAALNIDKGEK